jgi:ribosome biogenesis GTPase A
VTNLSKYLRVVDIIFEVADARCPFTSRSRQVKQLIKDKRSLLILNKADLADPHTTADWVEFYADRGEKALPVDALHGKGMAGVRKSLDQESQILHRLLKEKGRRNRPLRVAVMGIPNTGKSSFLNQLLGRRVVHRGDRPGITRGPQWVHLQGTISVLAPCHTLPYSTLFLSAASSSRQENRAYSFCQNG